MRVGLTTSVALHVALIGFGLITLSAPAPLDAANMESFPVDIVPLSEFAESVQGEKTAPLAETSAPLPTTRPDDVPDATNIGDNIADLTTASTPEPSKREVESATTPPPASAPEPSPRPEEAAEPDSAPPPAEAQAAAEPEAAASPPPTAAPEPLPQEIVEQDIKDDPLALPMNAPPPQDRPNPPKEEEVKLAQAEPVKDDSAEKEKVARDKAAKAAADKEKADKEKAEKEKAEKAAEDKAKADKAAKDKADKEKAEKAKAEKAKADKAKAEKAKADKEAKELAAKKSADDKAFNADEVAMLLNQQKAKGGGAKRSNEQASLGGKKTTGTKLSQSEMGALSSQLGQCWSIPGGAEGVEGLRVSVRFNVSADGRIDGRPSIDKSSGNRSFDESAVRAVQKCDREGLNLPKDKADVWAEVVVNFDPSAMF